MYLDEFNNAAKVVNQKEFLAKYKALKKAELSVQEKFLIATVEGPWSAVTAVRQMIGLMREHGTEIPGYHQDEASGEVFLSGRFLQEMADKDIEASILSGLTEKSHTLGARAFQECEDHGARFPNIG